MPTLAEVKAQIKALPHKYIFYTQREINYLPKILTDDERILALTSGYYGTSTVLLVCTNRRLLFVDKNLIVGIKVKQLNLDRIMAIDSSYVIFFGSLQINDGAATYEIKMVLKSSIDPFVKTVRTAIDDYRRIVFRDVVGQNTRTMMPSPQGSIEAQPLVQATPVQKTRVVKVAAEPVDPITQLERIAKLRDQGVLTEQEFLQQKQKILNS